jgi:hypothetical protein
MQGFRIPAGIRSGLGQRPKRIEQRLLDREHGPELL